MSALRAVLFASLVAAVLAASLLAAPTTAADGESAQPATRTLPETNNTSDATVGQQISGFMAQQTSQAEGAVESGMWSAAFENAPDESQKADLVTQRTEGLADEIATMQTERRELIAAKQAGEISPLEFRSRMSGLVGRYAALLAAINETEPRAEAVGANVSAIDGLRNAATKAVGPEVVNATGSPAVVVPPGLKNKTTGPPIDVPGKGNQNGGGNGPAGDAGNAGKGNATDGDDLASEIINGTDVDDTLTFPDPSGSGSVTVSIPSMVFAGRFAGAS